MKMAWEANVTLEASLAFGKMEEKVPLILEKPEICYELTYVMNSKSYNMNLTLYRQKNQKTLVKAKEAA